MQEEGLSLKDYLDYLRTCKYRPERRTWVTVLLLTPWCILIRLRPGVLSMVPQCCTFPWKLIEGTFLRNSRREEDVLLLLFSILNYPLVLHPIQVT